MASQRVRKRTIVRGRVQGVFFRDTCRGEALGHGVAGWVRNRRDGAVEAVFEGPPEGVDAMVEWAHAGPPSAVVQDVEIVDEPAEGITGFHVE